MASPPDSLGTHQRNAAIVRKAFKIPDRRLEFVAQRIISVIVEALDAPVPVQRRINTFLPSLSAAEFVEASVSDMMFVKQTGEGIDVECRVGPGAWISTHIGQQAHASCVQHGNDGLWIPVSMADRENGRHQLFSFVSALSLWAAT